MNEYSYSTSVSTEDTAMSAGILIFIFLLFLAVYALFAWIMGRIFKKLGEKQWKAWVPIYNVYIFLELGKQKGVWAILALIPIVNLISYVFMCLAAYHIALQLGKKEWFVVLYVWLTPIWLIWLAFDSAAVKTPEVAGAVAAEPVVK